MLLFKSCIYSPLVLYRIPRHFKRLSTFITYNMKTLNYQLFTILLFFLSCSNGKKDDCNLLETYSEQHKHIEFIECREGEGQVIKHATYKVKGLYSFEVEEYLVENYGMGKLHFTCCGWEPQDGKEGEIKTEELNINKNYHLVVLMTGNAEKMNEKGSLCIEKDRKKIDYFEVTVRLIEI